MADNQDIDAPEHIAEKFKFTIEMSEEAVFWLERSGQFSYVNDKACRSLGYTREELTSLSLWDIDPDFPRDRWDQQWGNLRKADNITLETRHRRKDGSLFPVEVSANQIVFAGKEFHAAFVRDISERKEAASQLGQSEQLYRNLFECVPDGILVANLESIYLDANPMVCKMLGYSRNEIIGMHAADIVTAEEEPQIEVALDQLKLESKHNRVWQFIRKDGSTFDAEVNVTQMPDGNLLALIRDNSERNLLEAQLRQAQKMESVGQLAGGIAHDFNNMLSVILGYATLVMMRMDPADPLQKDLQEIHNAGERSANITRQLLAFARKQTIAPEILDLNISLEGMLQMMQQLIGENISLAWHPASRLNQVKIDPSQLDQILANLCVNSRDAIAGVGKIIIETGMASVDASYCAQHPGFIPGEYVFLAVSDNGCGMDAETIEKVFEPFFSTKKVGEGTGLGLATVYGIVKQNNGFISVDSEKKQGTMVKIFLPCVAAKDSKSRLLTSPVPAGNGETLLVVEDEPVLLELTQRMLEENNYQVLAATKPSEALALADLNPGIIRLLITDTIMPEMNGRELAEQLTARHPEIKVLYMSGYAENIISSHGVLNEGIHFIQKPITFESIAVKVREVLAG